MIYRHAAASYAMLYRRRFFFKGVFMRLITARILMSAILLFAVVLPSQAVWQLTFEDNFTGAALDQTKWHPTGWVDNSYELQTYSADNVEVSNGTVKLWAKKNGTTKPYTSGKITTGGRNASDILFAQKYGRFEASMKLPKGKGMWPAFWLLPTPYSWPPEIDIMENWGSSNTAGDRAIASGVWCGSAADCGPSGSSKDERRITVSVDPSEGFHVYAMEWDSSKAVFYFDNQIIGTCTGTIKQYQRPMWVLVQLATCGCSWSASPDAGTVFPAALEVDYVRVYKWSTSTSVTPPVARVSTGIAGPVILFDLHGKRIGSFADVSAAKSALLRAGQGAFVTVPAEHASGNPARMVR